LEIRQGYPLPGLIFSIALEVLNSTINSKMNKTHQVGKTTSKIAINIDDIVIYIAYSKEINEVFNVQGGRLRNQAYNINCVSCLVGVVFFFFFFWHTGV
jgi:hypothetical protein